MEKKTIYLDNGDYIIVQYNPDSHKLVNTLYYMWNPGLEVYHLMDKQNALEDK